MGFGLALIIGSAAPWIHELIKKLNATFALKHIGKPNYFLGLEVKYKPNGSLILTQSKYIRDLLQRASMVDCKGISTPMESTTKLSRFGADKLYDPHEYRSIIEALKKAKNYLLGEQSLPIFI